MAPRSEEEKKRRKQEYLERKKARQLAKEQKKQQEDELKRQKEAALSGDIIGHGQQSTTTAGANAVDGEASASASAAAASDGGDGSGGICMFELVPEDALRHIINYSCSRELGILSLTSKTFNYIMAEARVSHLYTRLMTAPQHQQHDNHDDNDKSSRRGKSKGTNVLGKIMVPIEMYKNEAEIRELIQSSLQDSEETGRLITRKSIRGVKQKLGDADEYISYARFIEEAVSGYSIQSVNNKLTSLPPVVNGRFASASPEHSLCRIGGDGTQSGAGGSGCASWGVGKRGQLGHGKRQDESQPKLLLGSIGYGIRIVQVSAGGGLVRVAHSLLLTDMGRVLSFGNAQYGQLGHGYDAGNQLPDVLRPQYVEGLNGVHCVCVSAGELHSAVVTVDGDLYTWGDAFCGQLGLGDKRPKLEPQQVTSGGLEDECVLSVSCGARHTLAVTEDGEVYSFGLGHYGVLGRAYSPYQYHSDTVLAGLGGDDDEDDHLAQIDGIDNEMRHNLNLLANLTLDDKSDQCIPKVMDVLQGVTIVGVSAGHRHSILLDSNGCMYTCGAGSAGALGHGDTMKQDYPMQVMSFANANVKIMQISAGVDISMAVSTTGDVYAWGKTTGGRIGLVTNPSSSSSSTTTTDNVYRPTRVPVKDKNGKQIKCVDVECGYVHSMIVGCDGTLHMCGGVGTDGADDGQETTFGEEGRIGEAKKVSSFNIWHRIPEPKEAQQEVKWRKYGKYELKGRRAMMAEKEKWGS